MNVGKICTTATKIVIVLLGACLIISALSFIASADTLTTCFTWTSAVIGSWHSELNLTYDDITDVSDYVINPFIPRSYSQQGVITPITQRYQHYGKVTRLNNGGVDNGSTTLNVSTTNITDVDIAVNTVTFEFCVPTTTEQPVNIENNNFVFRYGSEVIYPTFIDILRSDSVIDSYIAGAPVQDQFTYSYQVVLYFDEIIRLRANSYFTFTLPVNAYSFIEPFPVEVGIVWGYNDIILEYYETYEEAQNAIIINSLTKYPHREQLENFIEENESFADDVESLHDVEQSLADEFSVDESVVVDVAGIVRDFDEMLSISEIPFIKYLVIIGMTLALISLVLYGV